MEVTQLYVYPVKSLGYNKLSTASIDDFGFEHDRRFMLVDKDGKFVTQRQYPKLSQVSVTFDGKYLTLNSTFFPATKLSIDDFVDEVNVLVWGDSVSARAIASQAISGLSKELGKDLRLVYMPGSSFRRVDPNYFKGEQRVSFADGFPFLLASRSSLLDLNTRLKQSIEMIRFRPNIVIDGALPYEEDNWKRLKIGSVEFEVVKPCSRCIMTTIHADGEKDANQEPLKTLSTYRKNEYGVCFGQNLVQLGKGEINVGDKVSIIL